jgi:Flp pilus assembly CpaF family ATPase
MRGNGIASVSEYAKQLEETASISRFNFDVALGPLKQYLDDPTTQDINVNPDGTIWISQGETGKTRAPEHMSPAARQTLIGILANRQGRSVDRLHARLAGDFPYYDVRYQGFGPPIADWALCLRCHAAAVRSLDEMSDMFAGESTPTSISAPLESEPGLAEALKAAIARGDNIAIVGRPGAGKTTLLNSILHEASRLRPQARIVTLEDRRELRASHADTLQLYARVEQAHPDGTRFEYGFVDLLSDALRTSFDLLAFGELRDGESAIALLMALNCGTSGIAFTLHADSAYDALSRLEDLIRLANAPVIRRTIARFVNTIVFLEMDDNRKRKIVELVNINGVNERDEYITRMIKTSASHSF